MRTLERVLWGSLALALAVLGGCSPPPTKDFDPDKIITIQDGQIVVAAGSPFLKHLESGQAGPAPAQGASLWVVGQVIALANPSDSLDGSSVRWSQLDPALSLELGLKLSEASASEAGEAYGVAELPDDDASQILTGETVSVSLYGLRKRATTAQVRAVESSPTDQDWMRVLLKIHSGRDWYPGSNCEIAFPLHSHPASVPTTALLHEGADEYVLRQTGPRSFLPCRIILLDTEGDSALVAGPIAQGAPIVARGAILLKPYLHQILRARNAAPEAKP